LRSLKVKITNSTNNKEAVNLGAIYRLPPRRSSTLVKLGAGLRLADKN